MAASAQHTQGQRICNAELVHPKYRSEYAFWYNQFSTVNSLTLCALRLVTKYTLSWKFFLYTSKMVINQIISKHNLHSWQFCHCLLLPVFFFNSLWPSDAIWQYRSGSTLVQVMACCLTAPSHYLNQCWLIISKIQRHSAERNFTRNNPAISH